MYLFHRGESGGSLWFYGMRFHRSALDQTALAAEEAIMAARTGTAQYHPGFNTLFQRALKGV